MGENPNLYTLDNKFTQNDFYRAIGRMDLHGYTINIETELDDLKAGDVDEETFDLINELGEFNGNDLYKLVGFLVLKNIDVTKVLISKKDTRITLHPEYVYFQGTEEDLIKLFMLMGFNPYVWIKEIEREGI